MISQVWTSPRYGCSDRDESHPESHNLTPLTAGADGVTSLDSGIPAADADMKDTPHCATQREQAKGIAKIFQMSTVSQSESKSYSFEWRCKGAFTVFGDVDVQNEPILEHFSGLNVH